MLTRCTVDEYPQALVPHRHGFPLDWFSNPCVHLRGHPSVHIQGYWGNRQVDLVCMLLAGIVRGFPKIIQVLANLLALAAVCPFVGSLSDLLGRRYVALIGASFLVLGMIVASTAHTMNIFICQQLQVNVQRSFTPVNVC